MSKLHKFQRTITRDGRGSPATPTVQTLYIRDEQISFVKIPPPSKSGSKEITEWESPVELFLVGSEEPIRFYVPAEIIALLNAIDPQ